MKSLFRMCLGDRADEALADVRELHARRAARGNRITASLRFAIDVLSIVIVGVHERIFSGIAADVRYAMRMLRKAPSGSSPSPRPFRDLSRGVLIDGHYWRLHRH